MDDIEENRWRPKLGMIDAKIAIKTGITAGLGWAVGLELSKFMERPDSLISGLWCTVTAIVVLQAHLGGTYKAAWNRFLGVLVGSLLGGLGTTLLGAHPINLSICVFFTVLICSFMAIADSVRIACLSVCVVMVLWGLHPTVSPWLFAFFRVIDSCFGILIAMIVAHTLWPFKIVEKLRLNISQVFMRVNQICRLVVRMEIHDKAIEEECLRLMVEIDAMMQQNRLYLEEAKMELLMQSERLSDWQALQDALEQLYGVVLTLYRVYQTPRRVFDEGLSTQLKQTADSIEHALDLLSHGLIGGEAIASLSALEIDQERLKADLARFRATHVLRKFSLQDVESFFVFFYSLNSLIEDLLRLSKKIDKISQ